MAVAVKHSYGSRLGNSFKGILSGLAAVLIGIVLLWWNEGRTVRRYKALNETSKKTTPISSEVVKPEFEGMVVHLTGYADTDETLSDMDFNITLPKTILLRRSVEIYQWEERSEEREDTTYYTYRKVWSNRLIDSSDFMEEGHDNPTVQYIREREDYAADVTLNAFRLSDSQIRRIGQEKTYALPPEYTPPTPTIELQKAFEKPRVVNDMIYYSVKSNNTQPTPPAEDAEKTDAAEEKTGDTTTAPLTAKIGDIRVKFTIVTPHDISIVAQQCGDSFVPYQAATGAVELQMDGLHSAEEMFASAHSANRLLCWILRLVGFILIYSGFQMIFKPIAILVSFLPFLERLVGAGTSLISFLLALPITLVVIALAWLFYRPVLAIFLIAIVIASFVLLRKKFKELKKPETTPAAQA